MLLDMDEVAEAALSIASVDTAHMCCLRLMASKKTVASSWTCRACKVVVQALPEGKVFRHPVQSSARACVQHKLCVAGHMPLSESCETPAGMRIHL